MICDREVRCVHRSPLREEIRGKASSNVLPKPGSRTGGVLGLLARETRSASEEGTGHLALHDLAGSVVTRLGEASF